MTAQSYSVFELQVTSWLKAIEDPYGYVGLPTFASQEEVNNAYDDLDRYLIQLKESTELEIKKKLLQSFQEIHTFLREEAHQLRDLSSDEEKEHVISKKRNMDKLLELRHLKKVHSIHYPDRLNVKTFGSEKITHTSNVETNSHSARLVGYLSNLIHKPYTCFQLPEFAAEHHIDFKFQEIVKKINEMAKKNPDDKTLQKAVNLAFWYSTVLKELSSTISKDVASHFPEVHMHIQRSTDKKIKKIALQLVLDNIHTLPGYKNFSKLKDLL